MSDANALKSEIVRISKLFYQRGWSLATSSNFSARLDARSILITASGKDKGTLTEQDVIRFGMDGQNLEATHEKASAEAKLHCELYRFQHEIGAVLHTHSVFATVLSSIPDLKVPLTIGGYEMLKAFDGVSSHLHTEHIPVFANDQDMSRLSNSVLQYLSKNSGIHGFLIVAHGLYSWGRDLRDALIHAEAFEFLLECEYHKLMLR